MECLICTACFPSYSSVLALQLHANVHLKDRNLPKLLATFAERPPQTPSLI